VSQEEHVRTSVSTRISAATAVVITVLGSGSAAASPLHHDQLPSDRQLVQVASASERPPTGEVDARLNDIIDTRDVDDADLLRGWRAELAELSERLRGPEVPPEYKQAVDKLVGKLGYAEKKVGSPEFPSIGRAVHDAAHDALRSPH
jgi:hypothetical protein